jgi:hypothetical protein
VDCEETCGVAVGVYRGVCWLYLWYNRLERCTDNVISLVMLGGLYKYTDSLINNGMDSIKLRPTGRQVYCFALKKIGLELNGQLSYIVAC